MNGRGETGLFPEAGPFENPHLEINTLGVVLKDEAGVLHEGGEGDAAGDGGFVAGVVDKVDGAGLGHEVEGGDEDDEEGGAENLEKIKVEGVPNGEDFMGAEAEYFEEDGEHDGDEDESQDVVH